MKDKFSKQADESVDATNDALDSPSHNSGASRKRSIMDNGKKSNSPLLGYFWDLVSTKPGVRQSTTLKMMTFLAKSQKLMIESIGDYSEWEERVSKFKQLESWDSNQEDEKLILSADVLYSLKRLVRGLPSSREAARQGFSLALSECLSWLSDVLPVQYVLHLIETSLVVSGGMKGQEEKDIYFGRLFAFMALIRSDMIRNISDEKIIQEILDQICDLASKKSFLSEWCTQLILDLAEAVKDNHEDSIKALLQKMQSGENTAICGNCESPEAIAIFMKLSKIYPVRNDE